MAEISDHNPQALNEDPDEPLPNAPTEVSPTEGDAREAAELGRLRRAYSRASTYQQGCSSRTAAKKPETFLECFTYGVLKFWRHQISVTVPHATCRDHLGKSKNAAPSHPAFIASQTQHSGFVLFGIGTSLPRPLLMQHVIWYFIQQRFTEALIHLRSRTVH